MKPMNANSWVDALSNKLEDINIINVSHLRQEIVQLNKKLRDYGHSMLHTRTLHLIAQEAEKEVVSSEQKMNNKILLNYKMSWPSLVQKKELRKQQTGLKDVTKQHFLSHPKKIWANLVQIHGSEILVLRPTTLREQ
jgi:hypothetical protein